MLCRRLLARLCIAREEIAGVAAERHWKQKLATENADDSNIVQHTQAVPKAAIAFLKELLTVSDPTVRRGSHASPFAYRALLSPQIDRDSVH